MPSAAAPSGADSSTARHIAHCASTLKEAKNAMKMDVKIVLFINNMVKS